ncbi:Late embryogenesis abundant (LEA) hydroxyproline-rich glycoprotein family [Zea mays]|uniref:Late embryogenesis abundant (LEA) hydroxyproline-rich glycoprotein family n=1 Tax=Zea mays TaxID=4577 RepID=A0A1D6EQW7_MAIZE|nr:Late embryogenesis abundant (LEA) hydroxyproline-rich glycoprotein family [Zea mays]
MDDRGGASSSGSSRWRGCRDKESSYGHHHHWPPPHSARCLCLCLLLSLTLLLAAAAALLAVFVTRLKKPAFYLQSIQMDRSFSLLTWSSNPNRSADDGTAAPCAVASLVFAAQNLNGVGIRYGATVLDVAYANESVGALDVPALYQPPRSANVTVLVHAVLAQRNVTRLLVGELSAQRRYMEVRVAGRVDARTHIMNVPLPKVQFSLDCRFGANYTEIVLREGIESVMTRKVFLARPAAYNVLWHCSDAHACVTRLI